MGTEMFFMKVDGHITENGQEDKLNSEKCGTGGPLGKTLNGYHPSLSMAAYEAIWEKDSGVGLKQSRLVAMVFKILRSRSGN